MTSSARGAVPDHRRLLSAAALTLALGVPVAACSSSGSSAGSAPAPAATAAGVAESRADALGSAARDQAAPAPATAPSAKPVAAELRQLVKKAALVVQVGTIDTRVVDARAAAAAIGGDVLTERITTNGPPGDNGRPTMDRAELVVAVPAAKLDAALTRLSGLGDIVSRTVSSEDVTGTVVDLQSRVTTMRASIARVRALMSKAQRIGEIVALESQLAEREAEYEALTSRLAKLSSSVARSTITLTLQTKDTPKPDPDDDRPSFTAALSAGWTAFLRSAAAVIAALGWLLPWLAAGALLLLYPLLRWRRGSARPTSPRDPEADRTGAETPPTAAS